MKVTFDDDFFIRSRDSFKTRFITVRMMILLLINVRLIDYSHLSIRLERN